MDAERGTGQMTPMYRTTVPGTRKHVQAPLVFGRWTEIEPIDWFGPVRLLSGERGTLHSNAEQQ